MRYTHDQVKSSATGLLQDRADRLQFDIDNGPSFRTIGWRINYGHQTLHFKDSNSIALKSLSGTLTYLLSQDLMYSATAGYEKNTYASIGEKPEGRFWLLGMRWEPSQRTSIDAKMGNRFYGDTYAVTANHRSRRSVWSIGYSEEITTTPTQFALPVTASTADFLNTLWKTSIPDPDTRQQVVDRFMQDTGLPSSLTQMANTISNRVFLQKILNASVAFNGARSTVVASVFNIAKDGKTSSESDAELIGTDRALLESRTRQSGVNAMWNWSLSQRTALNVSAGRTKVRSLTTGQVDRNKTARIALSTQFQRDVKGTVELHRSKHDSSARAASVRENTIAVSMLMRF